MEGRKIPNPLAGPPPVAEAIPIPPSPVRLSPPQLVMSAAAQAMMEATRQKKRRRKKHMEQVEVAVAPSPSPGSPATPEPKIESLVPLASETLPSEAVAAARRRRREERKRKKNENQAAAAAASPLVEQVEEAGKKEKKKRKHGEAAASLFQSAVAGAPILEGEDNAAAAEAPAKGRKKRRRMKEQEQSGQSPLPSFTRPQGGEAAADGTKCESVTVRKSSSSKKPRVLSDREIIRMRIEARKQQPLPEGLLDAVAIAANPCPNSVEQNPNHSSPFGAFFDQFCYKPDCQQGCNALPLPKTPVRPARPPSRGHPSSESSQLTANRTCKAAKTTKTSNAERPGSAPASGSGSPGKGQAKEKGRPEKKMVRKKKPRKPSPLLSTAEKRSDKYRRLPLDQLVPPPRSPHKLLQEKYASDPWKVVVICMLLNLTQGKQVRKKVKGFFRRYPDPQTAYRADPGKMTEYLAPLGLQRVKVNRIQRFSKAYVETEWTYITELCGVGKYAADAYAIFCAGRATEVVPEDHKLVDYWKYVCFELP